MGEIFFAREAQITYKRREPGERKLGTRIALSTEAATHIRHAIGDVPVEHFVVLALDARQRVIARSTIAIGGATFCGVEVASVLRFAILAGAVAIIVGHNHPSGDPSPSPEDVVLTERIFAAAKLIGIKALDHVIVADEGHFSFLDAGLVKVV